MSETMRERTVIEYFAQLSTAELRAHLAHVPHSAWGQQLYGWNMDEMVRRYRAKARAASPDGSRAGALRPYEEHYRAATERLLARYRTGELTEGQLGDRLGRVLATRNEKAAKWDRADRRDARHAYRRMSTGQKRAARLAFRANRPRTP